MSDQSEIDQLKDALREADQLLRIARHASMKLGLSGRGSDISLPHEVRMFALHFSRDEREGDGALQVKGTGRVWSLFQQVKELLSRKSAWRPISEAPKDGSQILAFARGEAGIKYMAVAQWADADPDFPNTVSGWFWTYAIRPTHWMPLPNEPVA